MKNKLTYLLLLAVLIVGVFIRFSGLNHFPPSPNWDEVSLGYNAYSLLLSGKDEWGIPAPLIFRAYGDYKLPVFVYLAVPFVAVFNLTAFSVRLVSALAGVGMIITAYVLAFRISKNKTTALLTAFLVMSQPWTLFLSRVAVEANLAAFLFSLGVCLALSRRPNLAAFFIGLSAWTYNSYRFLVPALFIVTLIVFRKKLAKFRMAILIMSVFLAPLFVQLLQPSGQARFNWLTILDSGAISSINASRSHSNFPYPRLIYNKFTYFTYHFIANYVSYFSPQFLFIGGGSQYQFNIPGLGLLSWAALPFFYLGIIFILLTKNRSARLVLVWLILAPVAGSLTRDSPHTLRAITFLPLPMLITAFGLSRSTGYLGKTRYLVYALFSVILIYSAYRFTDLYLNGYPVKYSWAWQYGYSQAVSYITDHYSDYDQIIFTKKYGEPHEFVLFFMKWNPQNYNSDSRLVRYFRTNWYWVDGFSKFRFVNDWEMPDYISGLSQPGRYLIISAPDNQFSSDILENINFLDGQTAFIISQKSV